MYKIPLVIFAGGKSSRMGRDKSQLAFGGYSSLSEYQYRRMSALFETVYLSAKSDKFDFECRVLEDNEKIHSPLAALVSVFENLDVEEVFILSVDAPFIDNSIIDKLIEKNVKEDDIVVAESPYGPEPLCAIYKRTILPEARAMLEKEQHRLTALLDKVKTKTVKFKSKEPFLNLNHPEEYEKALRQFLL